MEHARTLALVLLASAPFVGCGDETLPADGDDAGPVLDDAAADAATDAADPTPPGVLRTSYIGAQSYAVGNVTAASIGAAFYDQDPSPISVTTEALGPCVVRSSTSVGEGGFPQYRSAGTLTLSGGAEDTELTFGAGGYGPFSSEAALWAGGETLTLSAAGAVLAAFEVSMTAPSHLTITAPPLPVGASVTIDRGADLPISWTGSSAGTVRVQLIGANEVEPYVSVRCDFAVADGSGVVPVAALGAITAGAGSLSISVESAASVFVPEWGQVHVVAESAALVGARPYLTGADYE